jgi:hypothetical protein
MEGLYSLQLWFAAGEGIPYTLKVFPAPAFLELITSLERKEGQTIHVHSHQEKNSSYFSARGTSGHIGAEGKLPAKSLSDFLNK